MNGEPVESRRSGEGSAMVTLVIAVLALVVAALAVAGLGASSNGAGASAASAPTGSCAGGASKMTVHGTGMASGTPDLLTLSLSVSVTGGTAQAALADDNTRTQAVEAALAAGGVAKADMQTTNLTINPDYTFEHGSEVLTGYAVNNSVVAKLRQFGSAGGVIDAASSAGGNAVQISSLSFSIEDPRKLQDTARHDAVSQAVSHAGAMAAAAGEHLGPVCSLSDDTTETPPPSYLDQNGYRAASTPASAVPLQPGSQQATAQVTLVYALEPGQVRHH
jgi:uncharacterized protein YggE